MEKKIKPETEKMERKPNPKPAYTPKFIEEIGKITLKPGYNVWDVIFMHGDKLNIQLGQGEGENEFVIYGNKNFSKK